MKHPVIFLIIYPIHSHGVAVDPCDQLCRLDSSRCTAGSYMKNGVCHGYIYSGPRSSGEFCYHTTATSLSCPDSFEPVYVIDAPLLIRQRINQSARAASVPTGIVPNIRGARSSAPRTVLPTRTIFSTVHDRRVISSTVSDIENSVPPNRTSTTARPPSIASGSTTRTIFTNSEAYFHHSSDTNSADSNGGSSSSGIVTTLVPESFLAIASASTMRQTFNSELASRNVISAFRSSPRTEPTSTTSSPSSSNTLFATTSSPSSSTTSFSTTSSPSSSTTLYFTTSSLSSSTTIYSTTLSTASNDASEVTLTSSSAGSTELTTIELFHSTGESPEIEEIINLSNDIAELSSSDPFRYEIADLNLEGAPRDDFKAESDSVVFQPLHFGTDSNSIPVEKVFESEFAPRSTASSLTGGESSFDDNSDDDYLRFDEIYSQKSSEYEDSSFDMDAFNDEHFRGGFDLRFHEIYRNLENEPPPVREDFRNLAWEDIYSESESDNGNGDVAECSHSSELGLDMIYPEQMGAGDEISICDNNMRNPDRDNGLEGKRKVTQSSVDVEMPPLYFFYTRTKSDGNELRTRQLNNEEKYVGILSERSVQLPSSSSQDEVRFEDIYSDVELLSVEDVRFSKSIREDEVDFKIEDIYINLDKDGDDFDEAGSLPDGIP